MRIFNIDITRKGISPVVQVTEHDAMSRFFTLILRNGNADYEPPENPSYSVWYKTKDSTGWYDTIEEPDNGTHPAVVASGNMFTIEIAEAATTSCGELALMITGDDGYQLTVTGIITQSADIPGYDSSEVENYYNVYITRMQENASRAENAAATAIEYGATIEVDEAAQQLNITHTDNTGDVQTWVTEAEAWAVGQRDGVDVPSTDETYHNNAKYYAQAAAQSAASLTVDTELSSTSTNPVQNKVIDATVTELKNDLDDLDESVNGEIVVNYTEGKNLSANSVSHNVIDDPNACISDLIPVTWGSAVCFWYTDDSTDSKRYQIWFFDSNKEYIDYKSRNPTGMNNRTVALDNGTAYIQFSFKKGFNGYLSETTQSAEKLYVAGSTINTPGLVQEVGDLEDLDTSDKSSLVSAINEVRAGIPEFPITPKDTSFFHISKNMINPSDCVAGEYVNQATGAFASLARQNRTTYIEVAGNTTYVVRTRDGAFGANFRYVFYNSAKGYISGAVGALPDMLLTSPANAKYIVISETTAPSDMMIAPYVDEDKSFEAFDNVYVKPQFIVAGDADDIVLNLPEKMYALVGYELNIYFDNITENADLYKWDVTCSKGMQLERGYRVTPVAGDVGTYTLTIRASISDNIYKEATSSLIISATAVGNVSVIVLGDSTTYNGIMIGKMHDNFAADNVSLSTLGTMGASPNNHEGRSGWTVNDYFTKASIVYPAGDPRGTIYNAFYNPTTQTFDANYYFTNSGVSKPDWFIINMGINDVFGYTNDTALLSAMTTILDRYDLMIASIQEASPNTKIGICVTIPPNHSQDAFGKDYNCGQTRDRCKRNNAIWAKALIEKFDSLESDGIYVIPINVNLDTIYNMGLETMPVNARNTDVTYESPVANGGVHPVESGYWQIADVYTAFLQSHI